MSDSSRMFAVIPAAGLSRRMGQPKLLLELAGRPIIERLLEALEHPDIASCRVAVRPTDVALQNEVLQFGGSLVVPSTDPLDMRDSVELALESIRRDFRPNDSDGWLLVPADHPVLDGDVIQILMTYWHTWHPKILVPRCGQRRGHPTIFRWDFAEKVAKIPIGRGLNWLLREFASDVTELPIESSAAITDLDTPEDYAKLKEKWEAVAMH